MCQNWIVFCTFYPPLIPTHLSETVTGSLYYIQAFEVELILNLIIILFQYHFNFIYDFYLCKLLFNYWNSYENAINVVRFFILTKKRIIINIIFIYISFFNFFNSYESKNNRLNSLNKLYFINISIYFFRNCVYSYIRTIFVFILRSRLRMFFCKSTFQENWRCISSFVFITFKAKNIYNIIVAKDY